MDPFKGKQLDDPQRHPATAESKPLSWLDILEQLAEARASAAERSTSPTDSASEGSSGLPPQRREERPDPSAPPGDDPFAAIETPQRDHPETNRPIEPRRPPSGLGKGLRSYVGYFVLLLIVVGLLHQLKPMPEGTHLEGAVHSVDAEDVEFLYDLTYRDENAQRVIEQQIFDHLYQLIDSADAFLVVDMFLFNRFAGDADNVHRPLTTELTERLLERRREAPDLPMLLITDPINTVYGSEAAPHLDRLRQAGVTVVITDLRPLRDSNPLYSSVWRVLFQWFGNDVGGGDLANPFDPEDQTTLRSYLHLVNFKANHRKVLVAGRRDGPPRALVTSANPHDGSSAHSNVAFVVEGAPAIDLARSELDIARFSGWTGDPELESRVEAAAHFRPLPGGVPAEASPSGSAGNVGEMLEAEVLSEGGVRDRLLEDIAATTAGDWIDGAVFYLSHRGVVEALLAAARRGVRIRLILDANRDAFGREKNGIPNRSVAHELRTRSEGAIEIRWYETHGEQFHTKMMVIGRDGEVTVGLGSSNLTRRNLDDYNLEVVLRVVAAVETDLALQVGDYFERLWSNRGGALYTVDYEAYADPLPQRYWAYRVMEATGLSTF